MAAAGSPGGAAASALWCATRARDPEALLRAADTIFLTSSLIGVRPA